MDISKTLNGYTISISEKDRLMLQEDIEQCLLEDNNPGFCFTLEQLLEKLKESESLATR